MEPILAVIVACIAYVIILFWLVGSKIFLLEVNDMWCIYDILLCIAYAGVLICIGFGRERMMRK